MSAEFDEIVSQLEKAPYKVRRAVLGILVENLLPRHRGDDELAICNQDQETIGYFLTPQARNRLIDPALFEELRRRQQTQSATISGQEMLAKLARLQET